MKMMNYSEKIDLIDVALGTTPADKVIKGGKLVNVYTLEIYPADIAIKNGKIAYIGDVSHTIGPDTVVYDAAGCFLAPGLICTHMHVGGTHINMTEFGKLALMHGATAITTDMYEIGIVTGTPGIRFMIDQLKETGLKPLFCIPMPAYHQNESFENIGTFTEKDAITALNWEDCYGANEINLAKLAAKDEGVLRILDECQRLGKTVVGHASELRGKKLQAALCAANLTGDHENVNWEDANEEARLGMCVQLREGSVGSNIDAILAAAPERLELLGDWSFSTDEIDPAMMNKKGHMDNKVRMAIAAGVSPAAAVRAASLNAARSMRLDHLIGSITPAKCADILILSDLEKFVVRDVFADGELLIKDCSYIKTVSQPQYPAFLLNTVKVEKVSKETFKIKAPPELEKIRTRVIGIISDGNLFSDPLILDLPVVGGYVEADLENDVIKIFQFDRHSGSGRVGKGFIKGMGIADGAIASSYNPGSENLNVVGSNDQDMAIAANYIIEKGGGFVAVKNGEIIAALDLPIGGILSPETFDLVGRKMTTVHQAVHSMGCKLSSPYHQLAFMVFPAHFGTYKLCTYGVADADAAEIVSLFI